MSPWPAVWSRNNRESSNLQRICPLQIQSNFYNRFLVPNKHQILSIRFDDTFWGNSVNNLDICRASNLFDWGLDRQANSSTTNTQQFIESPGYFRDTSLFLFKFERNFYKARFKRRILHAPNRIAKLTACKMRRLNQLNAAYCISRTGPDWTGLDWTGLVKRRLVKRGLVKRGLVKRGLVTRGLVKRGLVKRGLVKRGLVKRGLVKRGLVKRGLVKRGLVKRGLLKRGLVKMKWKIVI